MTREELHTVSIERKVYHAHLGEGLPTVITPSTITVKFESGKEVRFISSGSTDTRLIEELYLTPVKIVEL